MQLLNTPYNKTVLAAVVGIVLVVLNNFGIKGDTTVTELVNALVVASAVYFVPNKK